MTDPEVEAQSVNFWIGGDWISLEAATHDEVKQFSVYGKEAVKIWSRMVKEQDTEVKLELSNGEVYILPIGANFIEPVARMLEVCPS